MVRMCIATLLLLLTKSVFAAYMTSPVGKIVSTMEHIQPSCKVVVFKENATGSEMSFRIPDVSNTDISSVVLAALMGNRDTTITYDPGITTGCGSEPEINYITVY